VSKAPQSAASGDERADPSSLLVWNGLVTRMRRIGAARRKTNLASMPPAHSMVDEAPAPSERRASIGSRRSRGGVRVP
jgi:hypothetical protein